MLRKLCQYLFKNQRSPVEPDPGAFQGPSSYLRFCWWSLILTVTIFACATHKPYEIDLMPAPDIYEEGGIVPFTDSNPLEMIPYTGMLYATDRLPAVGEKENYVNERGGVLRLGSAQIKVGSGTVTWEEARRISLLKNRTEKYPLQVTDVEEIGILDRSISILTPPDLIPDDIELAARRFADYVNAKLNASKKKDIYIYVHGYKVVFENPILVATELWHFLGYDGVFIAFAWPSTPETLAYASDLETAIHSSHNLRIFLDYLAEETQAERIHIIGYSAGTRVVINALAQLMFIYRNEDYPAARRHRIGHVILVGSDFERYLFGVYLNEGLMQIPDSLSVYASGEDKALNISQRLFRRERLGQLDANTLSPLAIDYLRQTPALRLIDVTEAEGATTGNGHAYFRKSPWASSDILMTLMFDLNPDERGLVRHTELPIWNFPEDYIPRLKKALSEIK